MKQTITAYERDLLDSIAVAADQLAQVQLAHVEAIQRLLLVDGWDRDGQRAIREFVAGGARESIERFLKRLGVEIADPLTDGP